jgi:hypothetical protein
MQVNATTSGKRRAHEAFPFHGELSFARTAAATGNAPRSSRRTRRPREEGAPSFERKTLSPGFLPHAELHPIETGESVTRHGQALHCGTSTYGDEDPARGPSFREEKGSSFPSSPNAPYQLRTVRCGPLAQTLASLKCCLKGRAISLFMERKWDVVSPKPTDETRAKKKSFPPFQPRPPEAVGRRMPPTHGSNAIGHWRERPSHTERSACSHSIALHRCNWVTARAEIHWYHSATCLVVPSPSHRGGYPPTQPTGKLNEQTPKQPGVRATYGRPIPHSCLSASCLVVPIPSHRYR